MQGRNAKLEGCRKLQAFVLAICGLRLLVLGSGWGSREKNEVRPPTHGTTASAFIQSGMLKYAPWSRDQKVRPGPRTNETRIQLFDGRVNPLATESERSRRGAVARLARRATGRARDEWHRIARTTRS